MRLHFLALLFLVALSRATAQDASLVPSLLHDYHSASNDSVRSDALARICFNLIRTDPDSARLVGEQALALARKSKALRNLGDAHNNLGWLAVERGELQRADSLLRIARAHFDRIGDPKLTAAVVSNQGWLAEKQGDRVRSLEHFQAALAMSEQAQDRAGIAIVLYSIGITYRKVGEMDQALEHIRRAIGIERSIGRTYNEANCLMGLGNTYREMHDTLRAIATFDSAAVIYRRLADHSGLGLVQENLGDLSMPHAPKEAMRHYAVASAHYDTIGSRIDRAYVLLRIGSTAMALRDMRSAAMHLQEGRALADAVGEMQLRMEYEEALARLAREQKDAAGVYHHWERYMALKDSMQGSDTERELARLRTAFDTERKEKDNQVLRAENSEQQERIRRREIQLYGSIALALLALTGAFLIFRNYRQKRRHADLLQELNGRLSTNNAEIREINELLEMKLLRSQMNPHFVYNCLSSAARMTQAGRQAEALAYLQGLARLLRMVLDHSVDDHVPLAEEMAFLRQYLKLESVHLEDFVYTVDADRQLLDADAGIPALLVQPFVENSILHGLAGKEGPKRISIHFSGTPDTVLCTIEDNGLGREGAPASGTDKGHRSLGMQLTTERLRLLTHRMADAGAIQFDDLRDADGRPAGTRVQVRLSA